MCNGWLSVSYTVNIFQFLGGGWRSKSELLPFLSTVTFRPIFRPFHEIFLCPFHFWSWISFVQAETMVSDHWSRCRPNSMLGNDNFRFLGVYSAASWQNSAALYEPGVSSIGSLDFLLFQATQSESSKDLLTCLVVAFMDSRTVVSCGRTCSVKSTDFLMKILG